MTAPDGRPQGAGRFKDHTACEAYLLDFWRGQGMDVTVSTRPPLVQGPYTQPGMTCPHGTTFWFEPTGDQIAQWVRDGVR